MFVYLCVRVSCILCSCIVVFVNSCIRIIRVFVCLCGRVFICFFCICSHVFIHLNVCVFVCVCVVCLSICVVVYSCNVVFVFVRMCDWNKLLNINLDNALKYNLNSPNVSLINEFDVVCFVSVCA